MLRNSYMISKHAAKGRCLHNLRIKVPVLLLPTTAELCAACALALNPAIADLQKPTVFSKVGKGGDLVLVKAIDCHAAVLIAYMELPNQAHYCFEKGYACRACLLRLPPE